MVECLRYMQEVEGSSPLLPTMTKQFNTDYLGVYTRWSGADVYEQSLTPDEISDISKIIANCLNGRFEAAEKAMKDDQWRLVVKGEVVTITTKAHARQCYNEVRKVGRTVGASVKTVKKALA